MLTVFLVPQVLHRDLCVHLLLPHPRGARDSGLRPENHLQPFLWRRGDGVRTADTLENSLLTSPNSGLQRAGSCAASTHATGQCFCFYQKSVDPKVLAPFTHGHITDLYQYTWSIFLDFHFLCFFFLQNGVFYTWQPPLSAPPPFLWLLLRWTSIIFLFQGFKNGQAPLHINIYIYT